MFISSARGFPLVRSPCHSSMSTPSPPLLSHLPHLSTRTSLPDSSSCCFSVFFPITVNPVRPSSLLPSPSIRSFCLFLSVFLDLYLSLSLFPSFEEASKRLPSCVETSSLLPKDKASIIKCWISGFFVFFFPPLLSGNRNRRRCLKITTWSQSLARRRWSDDYVL